MPPEAIGESGRLRESVGYRNVLSLSKLAILNDAAPYAAACVETALVVPLLPLDVAVHGFVREGWLHGSANRGYGQDCSQSYAGFNSHHVACNETNAHPRYVAWP